MTFSTAVVKDWIHARDKSSLSNDCLLAGRIAHILHRADGIRNMSEEIKCTHRRFDVDMFAILSSL